MRQDTDTLLVPLRRLASLLEDEREALRAFDLVAIARVAEEKIDLQGAIEDSLAAVQSGEVVAWPAAARVELEALHASIRELGNANARRLRASWNAARNLVDHVTGAAPTGYGRGSSVAPRPVLTADVG
jgi:hypothetical protein